MSAIVKWSQNEKNVFAIFVINVPGCSQGLHYEYNAIDSIANVSIERNGQDVLFIFNMNADSEYKQSVRVCYRLLHAVEPCGHHVKVDRNTKKIEITLKKETPMMWDSIIDDSYSTKQITHTPLTYAKWDAFLKEIEEEEEEDNDLQGSLQNIYKNATPEQQRAMIKSFQESHGTVLNTDWNDVKGKRIEPQMR